MRISDWSSDVCSSDLAIIVITPVCEVVAALFTGARVIADLIGRDTRLRGNLLIQRVKVSRRIVVQRGKMAEPHVGFKACARLDRKRSEERRVGKGCVSTCSSGWSRMN